MPVCSVCLKYDGVGLPGRPRLLGILCQRIHLCEPQLLPLFVGDDKAPEEPAALHLVCDMLIKGINNRHDGGMASKALDAMQCCVRLSDERVLLHIAEKTNFIVELVRC